MEYSFSFKRCNRINKILKQSYSNKICFFSKTVMNNVCVGRSPIDGLPRRYLPVRGVRGVGRHLRLHPGADGGALRLPAHAASALVRHSIPQLIVAWLRHLD